MIRAPRTFTLFLATLIVVVASAGVGAPPSVAQQGGATQAASLTQLVTDATPWLHIEAYTAQRSPVFLGATPREIELGLPPVDGGVARLPDSLRTLAETALTEVWQRLLADQLITSTGTIEVEGWPLRDDRGRLTWALARWRTSARDPWRWIPAEQNEPMEVTPEPWLPVVLDPLVPEDHIMIFGDPADEFGWMWPPVFGECVWVQRSVDLPLATPLEAWLPPAECDAYAAVADLGDRVALWLPPPARLNGAPVSYRFFVDVDSITMPAEIVWTAEEAPPGPEQAPVVISDWPADMEQRYRDDVVALDGEADAVYPLSGRIERFTIKNNAQPDNQHADMVEYLEERYEELGLQTWRQGFTWRGRPQVNLIAEIPGSDPTLPPILMADHYDTAFDEDLAMEDIWLSVPGADDNCSASAALLRAAEILPDLDPRRTIWLVHLTGEEFPSDCLGARNLVSELLADGQEIHGLVLLDMIGFTPVGDLVYQINPGRDDASEHIAAVVQDASADVAPELLPAYRSRYDDHSYLYNTDGIIFAEAGYPVVLINEHVNWYTRIMRAGYHDMRDTIDKMYLPYALAITRVSIETVARLAEAQPQ